MQKHSYSEADHYPYTSGVKRIDDGLSIDSSLKCRPFVKQTLSCSELEQLSSDIAQMGRGHECVYCQNEESGRSRVFSVQKAITANEYNMLLLWALPVLERSDASSCIGLHNHKLLVVFFDTKHILVVLKGRYSKSRFYRASFYISITHAIWPSRVQKIF